MYAYRLATPIDRLELMKDAQEVLDMLETPKCPSLQISKKEMIKEMEIAEEMFDAIGWEGDGEFKIMWIFTPGAGDGFGDFAYFVKQGNNGDSFICTHAPLHIPERELYGSIYRDF